jgi:hypothetical protein
MEKFWRLKFAGWRLWPLVGLINSWALLERFLSVVYFMNIIEVERRSEDNVETQGSNWTFLIVKYLGRW